MNTTTPEPQEIEVRINDHVLVTYTKSDEHRWWDGESYRPNCDYQVYVTATLGDATIQWFIGGKLLQPLEDWILHDLTIEVGAYASEDELFPIVTEHYDNLKVQLKAQGNESLRTWIQLAREKGKF